MFEMFRSRLARRGAVMAALLLFTLAAAPLAAAVPPQAAADAAVQQETPRHAGGEANLVLPDLGQVEFQGINGRTLLMGGLGVCLLGLAFGLVIFRQLRDLPVHRSMLEISELIYETCKTYLVTQGKFILILRAVHRRDHRVLFRRAAALRADEGASSSWRSASSASPAATAWRGSASASTRSPTRAPRSPGCAASRSRSTRSRSAPA